MQTSISKISPSCRIIVEHGSMLTIRGLHPRICAVVKQALTVSNPKYAQERRFSGFASKATPRYLYGYEDLYDGAFSIAPGAGASFWKDYGHQADFVGERIVAEAPLPPYSGETREYQEKALLDVGNRRQGLIVAPCGAGKTDLAIKLLCQRHVRSLIIVHTTELLNQWRERMVLRTGHDPQIIGGRCSRKGINSNLPYTIATVQTLHARPQVLHDLSRSASLVLVDECHHTPASTFTEVLRQLNPWYRYGITATPQRGDGLSCLMFWWIGPILARITADQLEETGHTLRPTYAPIFTEFEAPYDTEDPGSYTRLMKAMVEDQARMNLVANRINEMAGPDGRHHLVLANSIELCHRLHDLIPGSEIIVGDLGRADRRRVLENARSGATKILIATTIADEGLDLPVLDTVWLVTPTRSATKTQQRIGRICRPLSGKLTPRVFDFIDVKMEVFRSQFKNRYYHVYQHLTDGPTAKEVLR